MYKRQSQSYRQDLLDAIQLAEQGIDVYKRQVPNSQNVAPFRISPVKEQTKDIITNESGSKVGTITLQYQTEIQGGRPQFLYDKCYLKPNVTTYWSIDESHSEFSGDRIAVYFTFTYWGQFYETAVVYFYPD